ncbi:hypothetical protein GQ457_05G019300 [Hibiscus cannabinus]
MPQRFGQGWENPRDELLHRWEKHLDITEHWLLREIANSIACEGRDRFERCEVFGKWRARMSMARFELTPLSERVAESMRGRLNSGNRFHHGFTVKKENGRISAGWMGQTLTAASAWC